MSIFSDFKDRIDFDELNRQHIGTAKAGLVAHENAGGDMLLGISYICDFKAEEERGVGNLSELLNRTVDPSTVFAESYLRTNPTKTLIENFRQADFVRMDDEVVVFAATARPYDYEGQVRRGLSAIDKALAFRSGYFEVESKYWRKTVAELKSIAKERGLKGYSKLKREELLRFLVTAELDARQDLKKADEYQQPAWFGRGELLVFKRSDTVFDGVLQRLVEAARAGFLAVGNVLGFGSGLSLFDGRELSDQESQKIREHSIWYRAAMDELEPVAAQVMERHGYYALGSPTDFEGETKYWLNGRSVLLSTGEMAQPYGWYTLEELKNEAYLKDAEAESSKRVALKDFMEKAK